MTLSSAVKGRGYGIVIPSEVEESLIVFSARECLGAFPSRSFSNRHLNGFAYEFAFQSAATKALLLPSFQEKQAGVRHDFAARAALVANLCS
jgi:hypothetical protein